MLGFSFQEIFTSFIVLFAVIDVIGSIPVIISLNTSGHTVNAGKAAIYATILIIGFMFAGEAIIKLFNTDIESFAIAGSLILFALAIEMTFDIKIFGHEGPPGYATIVPVVFPLIAGAATLTTALTLRSEYATINVVIAILVNMTIVYFVLLKVGVVERVLGKGTIYVLRKFFGVILIAMSVKLFISNLTILLN